MWSERSMRTLFAGMVFSLIASSSAAQWIQLPTPGVPPLRTATDSDRTRAEDARRQTRSIRNVGARGRRPLL